MSSTNDLDRYRANLQGEIDASALYRAMAKHEKNAKLAEVYEKLAVVEDRHIALWTKQLKEAGETNIPSTVSLRGKVLMWLARKTGAQTVLPIVASTELASQTAYDDQPEAHGTSLPADERSHARVLQTMVHSSKGLDGNLLGRFEGRHRSIGGNALRAAVLGGNDGLVSNLSLIMGVAGADASGHSIVIAGLAGLMAGAFSMAIGEWVSVQSSRELYQREINVERQELMSHPDEEKEELALIYEAKGLPASQAMALAERIMSDPEKALDTLSREELGIDPEELGGSAWTAAFTSFALFSAGAILPLLPYFFLTGQVAINVSLVVSACGLFLIGSGIALLTGRSMIRSGLRQLAIGLSAAIVTYMIGRALGVAVS